MAAQTGRSWTKWRAWAIGAAALGLSVPGGHHFGGDYDRLAALILEHLHMPPLRIGKLANLTGRSVHNPIAKGPILPALLPSYGTW